MANIINSPSNIFPKGHTICHINMNGIKSKFIEPEELLTTNQVAVMCISESKLYERDPFSYFHVNNYTMYRSDRNRCGGGTLLYVNKSFKFSVLDVPKHLLHHHELEITAIRIKYKGIKPVTVISVYNPPSHSKIKFVESLSAVLRHLFSTSHEIIILGDVNIDIMKNDASTFKLFEMKKEFGLHQLIKGA